MPWIIDLGSEVGKSTFSMKDGKENAFIVDDFSFQMSPSRIFACLREEQMSFLALFIFHGRKVSNYV